MNVTDLKNLLDDYGDHLGVVIVVPGDEYDAVYPIAEVDTHTGAAGEPEVTLTVQVDE